MTLLRRYPAAELRAFCIDVLERAGMQRTDAVLTADGLIAADLRGVHSHGALRVGVYVDRLRAGSIDPRAELQIVRDNGAVVVADARAGPGIAMAVRAMDVAIERSRMHGVAVVSVRNGNHCGMLAHYAMRALPEAIGIAASNGDSQVAPWGARMKFFGTNPIAVAVPARDEPPVVLDMATSVAAHARVKGAADRGESIPQGWAIDPSGNPTTDPVQAMAGALLTFGGYKGSAIALLVDLLAGGLSGARSGPDIVPLYQRLDESQGIGQVFVALRVEAFAPLDTFTRRVDETVRKIRALPPAAGAERAFVPGELEQRCFTDHAQHGIPLPSDAVAEITRAARLLQMRLPWTLG